MPRYFFDVIHAGNLIKDEDGVILEGVKSIESELAHMTGDLGWESSMSLAPQVFIYVRDEGGTQVASASLQFSTPPLEQNA